MNEFKKKFWNWVHPFALSSENLEELLAIGVSLSAEKDLDTLLSQILTKARKILSADAGSLFLVQPFPGNPSSHCLRFMITQNDSLFFETETFSLPINPHSLAGYVAFSGQSLQIEDVYQLPPSSPFQFNREIDQKTGYRSKSLLSVALLDHKEKLIGVLQLWNKKKKKEICLTPHNVEKEVIPFTSLDLRLISSLASQAAVSIENARLYQEIQNLLEGFILASVTAIESRDPITFGHSSRVAKLTLELAKEINQTQEPPFQKITFSKENLKEIHYAGLLHDFGKIGVCENLLQKTTKLNPQELEIIRTRLDFLYLSFELEQAQRKLKQLKNGNPSKHSEEEEKKQFQSEWEKIQTFFSNILLASKSSFQNESTRDLLKGLENLWITRPDGTHQPILSPDQKARLSISKGNLTPEERSQVEAHVIHSYEFLKKIPWTSELQNIPFIAYAHHEKNDGSGYPRKIQMEQIPLPSQMMAVTDIFDALVARDRPYKKSVNLETALKILQEEAQANHLNPNLVDLFIQKKIYERVS